MALGKVYSFGPTFRAEKSKTRRHLTEFWMVEPEVAYATLDDLMKLAEEFISFIVARCLERRPADLQVIGRDISKLANVKAPFPRITYDEAVQLLHKGFEEGKLESKFEWGGDFGSPDETYISSQFDRPVMVHRYPAAVKAFYMEPDPQRSELALCVDVLAPEGYGEIIGGSQRMSSYELLLSTACRSRHSSGTWICASTAAFPTRVSEWESSVPLPGSVVWNTCARQFRFRGCCIGYIRKVIVFGRALGKGIGFSRAELTLAQESRL